jgi:ubiquinone/menaquinone biosynthesis C-methylase UbiE
LKDRLREKLIQISWLRKLRARLPYRLAHWQSRAMRYWQWNNSENIARNICGPSATLESLEERRDSIVWLLEPQRTDVCLDLGCGIGRVEKFIAPQVKEVHAVDFSATMLEIARKRLQSVPNVFFYQNDGATLPFFSQARFDLAWVELVFHHVPIEITTQYLKEISRVLKPSGRFICQLPRKEFYEQQSRDICGWMTLEEARRLVQPLFSNVDLWQDSRHIFARVVK